MNPCFPKPNLEVAGFRGHSRTISVDATPARIQHVWRVTKFMIYWRCMSQGRQPIIGHWGLTCLLFPCSTIYIYIYNYIYLYFFVWACGNIIFRSRYMFKDEMIVNGSYFLHVQLLLTCTDSVFENWKKEPMKNNPHGNHQHSSARQGRISDQL